MKSPYHIECEGPSSVQDFGNTSAGTDVGFQVTARQASTFDVVFDGFNGVWQWDRVVVFFVCFNQSRQHIQLVAFRRVRLGVQEMLDLL